MAAAKKKTQTKVKRSLTAAPRGWENDDELYPRKRDVCDFCGHRSDLKLSFDQIMWICLNASACVLRWRKARNETSV